MARKLRIDLEGGIHHVMNRGVDRRNIFFGDDDRSEFGRRLTDIHERFGVETLAYCLMGNHYHLLLRAVDGNLPDAMHHLGTTYVRRTNDRIGRDGPLFRGRYHSILVTTDAYLTWATRYIHRNPLDLASVAAPADYRWSSYRSYLGLRPSPSFLNAGMVLDLFADAAEFIEFTEQRSASMFVGEQISLDDIRQLVEFSISNDNLTDCDSRGANAPWLARNILVLLASGDLDAAVRGVVERHLAFPSSNARRMAVARARQRWHADPAAQRILAAVSGYLDPEFQGRTECA
jgi:REP element-mobilizing transposase RayT